MQIWLLPKLFSTRLELRRIMSEVGGMNDLHIVEYIVFGSLLVVSLSVGFFFAWKEKNQSAG